MADQVGTSDLDITNIVYGDAVSMPPPTTGGADSLTGGSDTDLNGDNTIYNYLFGDAQSSMTSSTGGSDILIGGYDTFGDRSVNNYLYGDAAILENGSMGGSDILTGGMNSYNALYGDAESMFSSTGGDDTLTGGANSGNELAGDAGFMISSMGGDDTLTGAGGANSYNTIAGDATSGMYSSTGGNDILTGGANSGYNYLYGDARALGDGSTGGNDTITGGSDTTPDDDIFTVNYLFGDAGEADVSEGANSVTGGDDYLVNAANTTDHMWGDFGQIFDVGATGGDDTFVFGRSNGNDVIYDFRRGEDTIGLNGYKIPINATRLSEGAINKLRTPYFLTEDGDGDGQLDDTIIYLDHSGNNTVMVIDVANLKASDFDILA
jgi:hypothetical protein